MKDVSVTTQTPKNTEIKNQELEVISTLADHFKNMGFISQMGVIKNYEGVELPAILNLNGVKSPRHDAIAYMDFDFYNVTYRLCVAPYQTRNGGECRTFSCESIKDFDCAKLAKRVVDNLISMGLLKGSRNEKI